MKRTIIAALLLFIIGNIRAADTESYQFIDHLLSITQPGPPEVYEDTVIFTAPSSHRRVGIAFAHENFSRVYWLRKLMVPEDPERVLAATKKNPVDPYRDSGILFHVQTIPKDLREMEYRMIIDGLWSPDPLNPLRKTSSAGLVHSRIPLPQISSPPPGPDGIPGHLNFAFTAESGEIITVAGNFNGWDPFMYEMKETSRGNYSLVLPLQAGTYQYVYIYRGERVLDPRNRRIVYTQDGYTASETIVKD